jgi:hypothetical protein
VGAALLLLFMEIHNAWDTVTYVAPGKEGEGRQQAGAGQSSEIVAVNRNGGGTGLRHQDASSYHAERHPAQRVRPVTI